MLTVGITIFLNGSTPYMENSMTASKPPLNLLDNEFSATVYTNTQVAIDGHCDANLTTCSVHIYQGVYSSSCIKPLVNNTMYCSLLIIDWQYYSVIIVTSVTAIFSLAYMYYLINWDYLRY